MRAIFADLEIVALERDTAEPGVFMLARKPATFTEKPASVALYSMVSHGRRADISSIDVLRFRLARIIRQRLVHPAWSHLPAPVRSAVRRVFRRG
jgi:hypothetical protein